LNTALRKAAHQQGEDLVAIGQPRAGSVSTINSGSKPATAGADVTKYVAVEGDSVSKMAAKFLGGNTRANRDAICAANPALKQDANKVIVGRTYIIPAASSVATVSPLSVPSPAPSTPVAQPAAASGETWYTVKEGDSLWRIATEQCGGAAAIPAIKELNKDTLKGGETVIVNQKLKLPGKAAVASN
jgi:nucleoid-associated protein YgaU